MTERWTTDRVFCSPRLYDLAFGWDVEEERDRVVSLLGLAPGDRVVVPACGTGRLAYALGTFGCDVHAFDVNAEMVSFAQATRAHERVTYFVHDMTKPFGDGSAVGAVLLCNSFRYLLDEDEAVAYLECVHRAIVPGGRHVLDLGLDIDASHVGGGTAWSLDYGNFVVDACWRLAEVAPPRSVDEVEIVRRSPAGEVLEVVRERQPQRLWTRSRLLEIATTCGFRAREVARADGRRVDDRPRAGRFWVVLEKAR